MTSIKAKMAYGILPFPESPPAGMTLKMSHATLMTRTILISGAATPPTEHA